MRAEHVVTYKMQTNPIASTTQERGTQRTIHSRQCGAAMLGNMRTEWNTVGPGLTARFPTFSTAWPTLFALHVGINYHAAGSPRSADKALGCPRPYSASPSAEGVRILSRPITHSEHTHIPRGAPKSTLLGNSVLRTDLGRAHYWRTQLLRSSGVNSTEKERERFF